MKFAVPSLALIALAACAPTTPAPDGQVAAPARQCFRPDDVRGFRALDRNTVIVQVGVNDRYRLDLVAPCPEVNWSERIAITSRSMRICSGLDADIVAPSRIGPQRCPVRTITKLTPEEAAALR